MVVDGVTTNKALVKTVVDESVLAKGMMFVGVVLGRGVVVVVERFVEAAPGEPESGGVVSELVIGAAADELAPVDI